MRRKRVLYLMHVPWNGVKQRPQFMAEALGGKDDVLVFYPLAYRHRRRLVASSRDPRLRYRRYYHLPFYRRCRWLERIDTVLVGIQLAAARRLFRPDVMWVPFAELHEYISAASDVPVVYDCMDDMAGFDELKPFLRRLLQDELALVDQARSVLVSSEHLGGVLVARGCPEGKITLVHNACSQSLARREPCPDNVDGAVAVYYGALSTVDWGAVKYLLEAIPELSVTAVGFLGGMETSIPVVDRLEIRDPIPHACLPDLVARANVLLMPFLLNELIYSVDPVKLYEYISFGKPIVCVEYPEIERFGPFVEFYRTPGELVSVLKRLIREGFPRKYTEEQRRAFLTENTWEKRAEVVDGVLEMLVRHPTSRDAYL